MASKPLKPCPRVKGTEFWVQFSMEPIIERVCATVAPDELRKMMEKYDRKR